MSMICQASRRCSIASSSFLYSAASAAVSSVACGSSTSVTSTHSAAPGPVAPGADVGAASAAHHRGGPAAAGDPADLHDRGDHAVGRVAVLQTRGDQQLAASRWPAQRRQRHARRRRARSAPPCRAARSIRSRNNTGTDWLQPSILQSSVRSTQPWGGAGLFPTQITLSGDVRCCRRAVSLTCMPPWRLRDFHYDDLDQAISVWDQSRDRDDHHPVCAVSEVVSAAKGGQPAVGRARR